MDKVYVVTDGSYSDYRITAVFSSEEKAKAFLEQEGGYESRIEEYPLDAYLPFIERGLKCFEVYMHRDGEASIYGDMSSRPEEKTEWSFIKQRGGSRILNLYTWAETREEAVKIANEVRTRLIASGEWPVQTAEVQ